VRFWLTTTIPATGDLIALVYLLRLQALLSSNITPQVSLACAPMG
jgi:hypothetical protein